MQWIVKQLSEEEKIYQNELSQQLNVSPILAKLLVLRGIRSYQEAEKFFRPSLSHLYSPFLMDDMKKAVYRLTTAIQNKEKILIYGDYDVDGTTAVSSMYLFLQQFIDTSLIEYYIPDRFNEGYGLSRQGVEYAKDNAFSLMLVLDCGIKDVEIVNYAQSLGIDCIICDHHFPPAQLPNAYAILNPKKPNCHYPNKELTGCSIGFKLMQAYCHTHQLDAKYYLSFIDLVATSTAADIVPIYDENRVLVYYGLKKINENPSIGLKKLIDIAFSKRNRPINVSDIVFLIAPRINAAGRLEHGSKAVQLLISKEEDIAEKWASELHEVNAQRQDIHQQTLQEAIAIIEQDHHFVNKSSTIVFKENWNKGVVGIVAAKLVEKYYRPTIVLTEHNGYITGSARSIDGFDIYEALSMCKDYLYQFGGHKYAAGLSIEKNQLTLFKEKFDSIVQSLITPAQQIKKIYIDAEISLKDITQKFLRILKQFEPHGPANMTPLFLLKNVKDSGKIHGIGNEHLRLYLTQNNYQEYPAIFYRGIHHFDYIHQKSFDCVCKIDIHTAEKEHLIYTLQIEDIQTTSSYNN